MPICKEKIGKDFLFLPCGHVFHPLCLAKWVKPPDTLTCPTCRADPAHLLPKKITNGYIGQTNKYRIADKKGIMKYPNGATYEGEWQNGKRHGTGIFQISGWSDVRRRIT